VSGRDLTAAGIDEPDLRASYELCRRLNARHGRTYYLATMLLPAWKRPYVHALYGFARHADEIVDDMASGLGTRQRSEMLARWGGQFLSDLRAGSSRDPVCRAVVDTARRWEIAPDLFESFLAAMGMDLTVTEYASYPDLLRYVDGSAATIGLEMLPVLGPTAPQAADAARDLGIAFQLANFVRDVGEDLDRGRLYVPLDELARFELTRDELRRRVVDDRVRALLAFQIARVRRLERAARPGIQLLESSSRPCVEAASVLYCGIVDEVERSGYEVFERRATVSLRRRLAVAGRAWVRSRRSELTARPAPGQP
jgi:15-cis-phytoene synthase